MSPAKGTKVDCPPWCEGGHERWAAEAYYDWKDENPALAVEMVTEAADHWNTQQSPVLPAASSSAP